MKSRDVSTYYEAPDGTEPTITVTVEPEDLRHAEVTTDLDALGVPEDEQAGVCGRAIEAYWAAERDVYLRSGQAERDGA